MMDQATFGKKWNELAELKRKVAELEAELAPKILEDGEQVKFGGLTAKISRGAGKYNYEKAILDWAQKNRENEEVIGLFRDMISRYTKIDYGDKMCKEAGIPKEEVPFTPSTKEPTVTFTLE